MQGIWCLSLGSLALISDIFGVNRTYSVSLFRGWRQAVWGFRSLARVGVSSSEEESDEDEDLELE